MIGKIENNQIKTILELPNLRMAYNAKNTQDDYYVFFVRGSRELYLFDVYAGVLYETSLELSQDERDTKSYTTKKAIIMDFHELKEKAYQSK